MSQSTNNPNDMFLLYLPSAGYIAIAWLSLAIVSKFQSLNLELKKHILNWMF